MIGRLKDIVTVSARAANVQDGYGGVVEAWTTKWTGFARVERLRGDRSIDAGAAALGGAYVITVRKSPAWSPAKTDKIDFGGNTYSIVSIDDDDDRWTRIITAVTK